MYPGTIFNWHDNSGFDISATSGSNDSAPLLMQVFSSDKGTEDLIEISGSDFDAMYGTMSFSRHGQSAIQAKAIIDAGGRLLAKRVVASDSTLANVVLCAKVTSITSGEGDEEETSGVKVTWESKSIENCKSFDQVLSAAKALLDINNGVYPIFVYTDNGRGVSGKAVRLTPDYATSKTIGSTFYTLNVYEGSNVIEQITITVDPDIIYNNVAYGLDELSNIQISGKVIEGAYTSYVEKLADELAIDASVLTNYDLVYGYTNKGTKLEGFELDPAGVDLDAEIGIALTSGTNGSFGTSPVNTTAWTNAIKEVFENTTGDYDAVYDVDRYKIAAICDANYPDTVKNAIFDFVEFRQDCVFLRDYGIGLTTFAAINSRYIDFREKRNYFTADYSTSYMIADPQTKKAIEVTCTYDIAQLLVNHIENNPYAPLAGVSNGFILKNAIKGTISFIPVRTPKSNQKEAMDDIRVNYAIFEDNDCVVQSNYTCQEANTQLSYLCNVVAIQRVLRAVRSACPRQRYSLSTSTDLQSYAAAVNSVLSNYTSNFATLRFSYTQDDLRASQKIFYAAIEFAFLGWAQTEIFEIYAINE
jgi:predicted RNA binding protein with dsRBD fold (UPF0201 family)